LRSHKTAHSASHSTICTTHLSSIILFAHTLTLAHTITLHHTLTYTADYMQHTHTHTHTHTNTHTHARTHTHIHTHAYTHAHTFFSLARKKHKKYVAHVCACAVRTSKEKTVRLPPAGCYERSSCSNKDAKMCVHLRKNR